MFASDTTPAPEKDGPSYAHAAPAAVDQARDVAFGAAETELVELASHIAAATARLLAQVVAMDRAGMVSAPDTMETWLEWRLSLSRRVAKDYVRVAYALEDLPRIAAAFGAGELSYDKVSSITKIATPESEDTLLGWALDGTAAQIDKIVSTYRQATAAASPESVNERHARRFVDHFVDGDGDFVLRGRLAPEDGAVVAHALDAYVDNHDRADDWGARRADALVEVAHAALGADFEAHPSHVDAYQVMVLVEPGALSSDEGRAELFPDVPILPRPPGALPATRLRSSSTKSGRRRRREPSHATSRARPAGRLPPGTAAAAGRGAPTSVLWTLITSATGRAGADTSCGISPVCVEDTIAWSTRGATRSGEDQTASSSSSIPGAGSSRRLRRSGPPDESSDRSWPRPSTSAIRGRPRARSHTDRRRSPAALPCSTGERAS